MQALILPVNGIEPKFGSNCFVAPNATIVGDFECGNDCSFWFNAVIRADVNSIRLGNKVNIQDGAVIHCTFSMHCALNRPGFDGGLLSAEILEFVFPAEQSPQVAIV